MESAHYRRNRRTLHGWIAALCFTIASAAPAPALPPQRIVSTFLCTDEYVFRLVPRAHIAALSFEAGDRNPVVSTIANEVGGIPQIHPTTEAVLDYKPDLVVMYEGTNPRLHAHLDEIGIPVFEVPWASSLAEVRRVTRVLGARLGAPHRADALIAEMDATLAKAKASAPRQPVSALIYEANGYAAQGSVTTALMAAAGLSDAAPELGLDRRGRISVESVAAAPPELLILSGRSEVRDARADLVLHHPALTSIADRTLIVWRPLRELLCPGPWSADAAVTFSDLAQRARALARSRGRN
jgi:iron complex transport system substrate-binding protein